MRRSRGLTLSEVVLALAILVVAVMCIASFVVTIYRSVKEGKYQAVGSTIAQSELERLRVVGNALNNLILNPTLGVKDETVPVDATKVVYHLQVTAQVLPAMGGRYVQLISRVTWRQSNRDCQLSAR